MMFEFGHVGDDVSGLYQLLGEITPVRHKLVLGVRSLMSFSSWA